VLGSEVVVAGGMCVYTFCLDAKSTQKNQGKPEPSGLPIAIGMARPTPPSVRLCSLIFWPVGYF
jgi:hypothetical protein